MAQVIIKAVKGISKNVDNAIDPKQVTKIFKPMLKAAKSGDLSLKKLIADGTTIRLLTRNGAAKVRHFIRESKNWRVNRWFALFALGYVIEEYETGSLQLGDDNVYWDLIADVFSTRANTQNGALFQLSQIVYFHIENKYGGGPKVIGIEQIRPAYGLVNGERPPGEPYKREIDIVLENGTNAERWVEVKSLNGPFRESWFKNTLVGKKKDDGDKTNRGYFRQHFHDMRLNSGFINSDNLETILNRDDNRFNWSKNANYNWYFHDFKKITGSNPPSRTDIGNAGKWLCAKPKATDANEKYYESNLSGSRAEIAGRCSKSRIELRNTQSYIKDLLRKYAMRHPGDTHPESRTNWPLR